VVFRMLILKQWSASFLKVLPERANDGVSRLGREGSTIGGRRGPAITHPRVAQPSQLTAGDSLLVSQSH
jgi:hypothetical protein